jgi:hypothetical protein
VEAGVEVKVHMGGFAVCLMTDRVIRSSVMISVSRKGRGSSL